MTDSTKKAEKEQGVFGRGVIDLIPLIEKGAEGIAQFREEAHEMGLVLSKETIVESREWKKEMRIAGEQVEALKFKLGALVVHGVVRLLRAWKDLKKANVDRFLNAVRLAVYGLAAATTFWLSSTYFGVANVARVLGFAAGEAIAFGWANVGAAAKSAAAWGLLALKFALVFDAVLDLKFVFNDIWRFFHGKGSLIGDIIKIWKEDIHSIADVLKSISGTVDEIFGIDPDQRAAMDKKAVKDAEDRNKLPFIERMRQNLGGLPRNPDGSLPEGGVEHFLKSMFSPAASAPTATARPGVVAPQFNITNNIVQQPGQDAKELAGQVRSAIQDFHETKMREAAAAVE